MDFGGSGDFGPATDYGAGDVNVGDVNVGDVNVDNADFTDAQKALDEYNAQTDPAWQQQTGEITADQHAVLTNTADTLQNQAVKAALKQVGARSSQNATPAQIQAAQQLAAQKAAGAGNAQDASMWTTASNLLTAYMGHQQVAQGSNLPRSTQYPASIPGATARQPDGSLSVRNADGTVSTVAPNGVVKTAALGASLGGNNMLLVGAVAVAGVLALSRRK